MSEVPFHLTTQGRQFFESTVPRLVDELARLNEALARIAVALDSHQKGR